MNFNQIPVNLLTPGQYVEFDNSRAVQGAAQMPQRILLIAPKLAAGSAAADVPLQITSSAQGVAACGRGSFGAAMCDALFRVPQAGDVWLLPVADDEDGVKATGEITFGGSPTAAGVVSLYVAGTLVSVAVAAAATAASVATAVAAAVNANADLPVTAAAAGVVVTLTARHAGALGNDIDLRFNYYPLTERIPAGLTASIEAMADGATNPSVAVALSNIGSSQYNTVICAFNDAANLALLEAELDTRWGPMHMNDGHCHVGLRGTVGSINTFLSTRNSPHLTVWTMEQGGEPQPLWVKAATAGAVAAYYLAIDPARPLQTLALPGLLPAPQEKRFIREERNNILSYGGATTEVNAGGEVCIERGVTTYTQNSSGLADPSYRDIEVLYTLSLLRYQVRARFAQKYPRHKLANDGTPVQPGQPVITPKIAKAEMVALYGEWIDLGLVENLESFKAGLAIERAGGDADRLNVLLPPDLINQLRVVTAQIQYQL